MIGIVVLLLPALLTGAATASPRQQPRDAASGTPAPAATIRGRVTAAATDRPLHRVRITLDGPLANPPTTATDMRGTYELTNLPAGSYTITAVRSGYLTLQYGQRRPREAGRTLEVRAGDTIEGIDLALPKGGVIAGRITDELGEPAPGVRVEATEPRYIRGQRVAVAARIATANDAGEYRLSGLEPGSYQVRASAREVWEADDGKETLTYAVTYERSGLQIVVTQKIGRVNGTVMDARGTSTPAATVVVFPDEPELWLRGSRLIRVARPAADGQFSITGLPAGTYRAIARDFIEDGQWEDRKFLEEVRADALRFTLSEGATETISLALR